MRLLVTAFYSVLLPLGEGYRYSQARKPASKRRMTIFDEEYRVITVERHRLTIRGVCSGNVLVINAETALNEQEYAPGKLIILSDPSSTVSS